LTPVEGDALWAAWRKKQEREDLRWARLTYFVAAPNLNARATVNDFRLFLPIEKKRKPVPVEQQWRLLSLAFPQPPATSALPA
jgi:hypothetical protein